MIGVDDLTYVDAETLRRRSAFSSSGSKAAEWRRGASRGEKEVPMAAGAGCRGCSCWTEKDAVGAGDASAEGMLGWWTEKGATGVGDASVANMLGCWTEKVEEKLLLEAVDEAIEAGTEAVVFAPEVRHSMMTSKRLALRCSRVRETS